jgi:hypothetical protein
MARTLPNFFSFTNVTHCHGAAIRITGVCVGNFVVDSDVRSGARVELIGRAHTVGHGETCSFSSAWHWLSSLHVNNRR